MNEESLATYTFLSCLQRGLSTAVKRVDGDATTGPRASIPITLCFDTSTGEKTADIDIGLFGPGEVGGIDPRVIIRRYPSPGERDAQVNCFSCVEFDQADFIWRHTPARANDKDRLRPWLVLIVLTEDEIESFEPATTDGRLAIVTVKSAANLPDLSQSWAWAHVQISGLDDSASESVLHILDNEPNRAISRLLCPRRLLPRTKYIACLGPALERGRRAGLNEDLDDTVDALQPAWEPGASSVSIPVFDMWTFQTGVAVDFEYLARQLKPWPAPGNLGLRDMDVSDPGPTQNLPPASAAPMKMESALMSHAAKSQYPGGVVAAPDFVGALQSLLNTPTVLLENGQASRLVAPPLYGRWYAVRDRLEPGRAPFWFNDLNADPRFRAACGLGTTVVQEQQQQLMASAWEQVEGILELQEKYRQTQLSRELAERVLQRHLAGMDAQTALMVMTPLHTRVRASSHTIHAVLKQSPIADGSTEAQLRRLARSLGPVGKLQGRAELPRATDMLERMNRGELKPAPPPPTPSDMATPSRTGKDAAPRWATPVVLKVLRVVPLLLSILGLLVLFLAILGGGLVPLPRTHLVAFAGASLVAALGVRRAARRLRLRVGLREGRLDPDDIRKVPAASRFVPQEAPPGKKTPPAPPSGAADTALGKLAVANFRDALASLYTTLNAPPETPPPLVQVSSIKQLRDKMLAAVHPEATIVAPLKTRTRLAPWMVWEYKEDPIEPPMPAPQFDQPMYEPLKELSQEWILAGAGDIPANAVSLLETNQRFVEAYMVGWNHEMTRELRYQEYFIDQRGTYARQFWDVRGYVPEPGETLDPETLRDIKPIHAWPPATKLGENTARRSPPGGEHLVLIIRSELFRRYPNTTVYACKARIGGPEDGENEGKRMLGDEQKHPVFHGRLEPDIYFFGFELTKAQARGAGSTDPSADQGWFFTFQQQASEVLNGLDIAEAYGRQVTSTDDLSWGDLVTSAEELEALTYIDLNADRPDTRWMVTPDGQPARWHADSGLGPTGATAADIAYITLQRPFRVGIHGADMLPHESE